MPRVSVTICCYNSERYLEETIDSVSRQTFSDWELVIVNDGSQDGTEEIIFRKIKTGLPIVYSAGPNRGFAAARNTSIELARGEYIALLDSDDICLPLRLERQVSLADSHAKVGLFFSNTEHFLDDGKVVGRQFARCGVDPSKLDLSAGQALNQLLIYGCFIDTESVLVRRKVVEDVGGFNESYRYIADYDFFLRAGQRTAMLSDSEVLARWRIHAGQSSRRMKKIVAEETIDLLAKWLKDSSISADARRMVKVYLSCALLRLAMVLARESRFGESAKSIRSAVGVRPGVAGITSRVYRRMSRAVRECVS